MREEVEKRRWVKKHRNNLPVLHREIDKRISVVKKMLWKGDPEPFNWWISGVLGLVPADLAILSSFRACLALKTEKEFLEGFVSLLSAVCALEYFSRVEKGGYKLLYNVNPAVIPTGYIHVFDLTPKELEKSLQIAIEKQGINKKRNFIIKRAETTPALPNEITDPEDELFYKAESQKNAYKFGLGQMLKSIGVKITASGAKKRQKFAETFFTTATLKIIEARTARLAEDYRREHLQHGSYEAEHAKSFLAGHKRQGNILGKYMQESLLKLVKGIVGDFGSVPLAIALGGGTQVEPAPDTCDRLYELQQKLFARRKHVQAIYAKADSRTAAAQECRQHYPELTPERIAEHRESTANAPLALKEAALLLRLPGIAYAQKLCNLGRDTARTNQVWADYLREYFPGTEKITPDNFPAAPPITQAQPRQ